MSGSETLEFNFDGLIGPSHNYAGMSDGNLASTRNAGDVSNPCEAALQGLEKMRLLVRAGLGQGVLPPLPRPNFDLLVSAGFHGSDAQILEAAGKSDLRLLKAAFSASSMWAANAATVSPSADAEDGRLHFTPANLSTMLHRSAEYPDTTANLLAIFGDPDHFAVHSALPTHEYYSDEGAANHVRLSSSHGAGGVEVFVHGREGVSAQTRFPARQTRLACESIVRSHGLTHDRTLHAQQSAVAIDAGAFHNDVVCVGTLDTLFFHEHAFENSKDVIRSIREAASGAFELQTVMVPDDRVPLSDAVSSYLFNSQLLAWPGEDKLVLLAPTETRETESTRVFCEEMVASNGPIGRVEYVDVRQSMRNGGGPACLRLRVVMTPAQQEACHPGALLDEAKIDRLQDIVRATYRDRVSEADLVDLEFANECRIAREALLEELDLLELA
ncbi:MAG: N-succinylarginine dihydrolase [Henriciella sp.]|nr:N-succinylarginine dihydrolase [Henriciella sp.]